MYTGLVEILCPSDEELQIIVESNLEGIELGIQTGDIETSDRFNKMVAMMSPNEVDTVIGALRRAKEHWIKNNGE